MMSTDMSRDLSVPWADGFVGLYRERYAPMVRLAYLLTADRSVAEELVQDAFVAVHRSWARVDEPAAYLRTVVVNGCRSWARHRRLEWERGPAPRQAPTLVADEMWDALGRLPDRQRVAIVLRFYGDLPDPDIAAVLGCRPATVRTAIHRGLAALRKEVVR